MIIVTGGAGYIGRHVCRAFSGEDVVALKLVAGMAADWSRVGANISVRFWGALLDRHIGSARQRLGPDADRVWTEGLRLSFDDVIRLAMTHNP